MKILHLSDIHFGSNHHAFTRGGKADPRALAGVLAGLARPDLIVISGDVGWSGQSGDYVDALACFRELRNRLSAPILIVPGNHDVDMSRSVSDDARQEAFVELLKQFYETKLPDVYPLLSRGGVGLAPRDQLIGIHHDAAQEFVVVSINSAARQQPGGICKGCGRRVEAVPTSSCPECHLPLPETAALTNAVDISVAQEVDRLIEAISPSPRLFRTFVLHHNLFPFTEPYAGGHIDLARRVIPVDNAMVANSADLQSWLAKAGFHLVLHGHKHQPHGRRDTLFRRNDPPTGRSMVVLGAGSAGVDQKQRGPEPLGFFVVNVDRLSDKHFQINAQPMKIDTGSLSPYATSDFAEFTCDVGLALPSAPPIFHAEGMVDCHAAIARSAGMPKRVVLRNFVSIVDTMEFQPPPTARFVGKAVDADLIRASFHALHPEYDTVTGDWGEPHEAHARLEDVPDRFQIQHGPRMFGLLANRQHRLGRTRAEPSIPIKEALETLKDNPATSHAFVGMFHPDIDGASLSGPPPALVGIQFNITDDRRLDINFTFRKLELAFWWSVNMYEAIQLWHWAHEYIKSERACQAGRITFFATLAEWRDDQAGATFVIDLDKLSMEEAVELVVSLDGPNAPQALRLLGLLQQKRERTNENNIDASGIARLAQVVKGLTQVTARPGGWWSHTHLKRLESVRDELLQAEEAARTKQDVAAKRSVAGAQRILADLEGQLAAHP